MLIFIPIFILASINLLMVSSLSPSLLSKQILLWLLALLAFFIGKQINPNIHHKTQKLLLIISCLAILTPIVVGQSTRGSKRWLDLGIAKIQPSETVKPALMLFLANTAYPLLFFIPVILVALQPDLGSAITLMSLFIPIIILNRQLLKISLVIFGVLLLLSPLIWRYALHDYQKNRVVNFLNPQHDPLGQGYQSIQSKIAIGSAGIFGKGYRKGSQGQLLFLPEKHNDFIFAATVEELGLLTALIIIISYYFIVNLLINQAQSHHHLSHSIFTIGIGCLILSQTFINIAMNLGILPVTGIPLPFLSAGGSSLVSLMFSLGIVFSS